MKRTTVLYTFAALVVVVNGGFSLLATEPAKSASRPAGPGVERLVKQVNELRVMKDVHAANFGNDVAAVVKKHDISIAVGAAKAPVAKSLPALEDDAVAAIRAVAVGMVEMAPESLWMQDGWGADSPLRVELLMLIATKCPSAAARVEAAVLLMERATRMLGRGHKGDVTLAMAGDAADAAVQYMFSAECPAKDREKAMNEAEKAIKGLLGFAARLHDQPDEAQMEAAFVKYFEKLAATTEASAEAAKNPEMKATLKDMAQRLGGVKQAKNVVQQVVATVAVRPVMKRFVEAVSNEDVETLKKNLTPRTAKEMDERRGTDMSLKEFATRRDNLDEIRFVEVDVHDCRVAEAWKTARVMVRVRVEFIDKDGNTEMESMNWGAVKDETQWLAGQ